MMTSFSLQHHDDSLLFMALEQSMFAVVLINEKDEVLFFNRAAEELWGYERQEVLGRNMSMLVPSSLKSVHSGYIHHNREGGKARVEGMSRELTLERKDKSTVWTRFALSKVNVDGKIHYLALVRDASHEMEAEEQKRLLIISVDHIDRPVIVLNTQRQIVQINRAFTEMFGHNMDDISGLTPDILLYISDFPAHSRRRLLSFIWQEQAAQEEFLVSGKSGKQIWIRASVSPVYDQQNQLQNIVMTFSDITEDLRLRELEKNALDAMCRHQSFQETGETICKYIAQVLPDAEVSLRFILNGIMSPWASSSRRGHAGEFISERSMNVCLRDGTITGQLTFRFTKEQEARGFIDRVSDISVHLCALAIEQEKSRQHIERLVRFDPLTGLPNRNNLYHYLDELLLHINDRQLVIFAISVDNIQDIIDTIGYSVTDQVVLIMANRLRNIISPGIFLSRTESFQFIMVCADDEINYITQLAEQLKKAAAESVMINGHAFHLTLSIGISYEASNDRNYLLSTALSAMNSRRRSGGNGWFFFNPEMNQAIRERLAMSAALKQAIAKGKLRMEYQPQIRTDTGELYGFEALARWHDPKFGEVSPAVFIPLAEDFGEIENIGHWALHEVCRQLAEWQKMQLSVPGVSVNLSAIHFHNSHLPEEIEATLKEFSIPGNLLTIEITESGMMELNDEMLARASRIKQSGVNLSIDDFGAGFSGFSRLANLPVSELKIDKSFIDKCLTEDRQKALLCAIAGIGKSLNLVSVAEGVESEEQFSFIRSIHCPVVQGYYFSKPIASKNIPEWLNASLPDIRKHITQK